MSKVKYSDVDGVIGATVNEAVWQTTVEGMQDKDVAWLAPKTGTLPKYSPPNTVPRNRGEGLIAPPPLTSAHFKSPFICMFYVQCDPL